MSTAASLPGAAPGVNEISMARLFSAIAHAIKSGGAS